ncbi:ABC transporter permease [Halomicronema hongdechloris C2206]|uniref:ABC transporter permease n=1 Tax=Halomicronema hongdechloris C2206 TaxID=1641165 RepID=A0A1V8NJ09_9CYAN|nr:hypothetical protein [Halomicronema hongdechloris]ASC72609.1 ABC transporter permease [Halomicronema hongdechloris C2206]
MVRSHPSRAGPRSLSWLNPLRHYVTIARSLILKGGGLEVLLPEVITLLLFAVLLLGGSIHRSDLIGELAARGLPTLGLLEGWDRPAPQLRVALVWVYRVSKS